MFIYKIYTYLYFILVFGNIYISFRILHRIFKYYEWRLQYCAPSILMIELHVCPLFTPLFKIA
jgi:hypothetical protein